MFKSKNKLIFVLALCLTFILTGCAFATKEEMDEYASPAPYIGRGIDEDFYTGEMYRPVKKGITSDGLEVRRYEVKSNYAGCGNAFYLKNGVIVDYHPTGECTMYSERRSAPKRSIRWGVEQAPQTAMSPPQRPAQVAQTAILPRQSNTSTQSSALASRCETSVTAELQAGNPATRIRIVYMPLGPTAQDYFPKMSEVEARKKLNEMRASGYIGNLRRDRLVEYHEGMLKDTENKLSYMPLGNPHREFYNKARAIAICWKGFGWPEDVPLSPAECTTDKCL